jgi:hypothetical protein
VFGLTAAIFGTLNDGKSLFSGCISTNVLRQIEKVEVSKLKFKKYQGRYGCSFLYPEDWELSIENPARDKQIRHPINPEISIYYSAMFYPSPSDFEDIQELGAEREAWLKEDNGKVISLTYYQQYSTNCDAMIEFGKLVFSIRYDGKGIKKVGIDIFTKQDNEVLYSLRIECPEEDYEAHKELMKHIISSITFDCKKMYDY